MQKPEDFSKFYFKKVGLGEGCGCAEKVIDTHEFDRLGGLGQGHKPTVGLWRRMVNVARQKLRLSPR